MVKQQNRWLGKEFPISLKIMDKSGFLYKPLKYLENERGWSLVQWVNTKTRETWWELKNPEKITIDELRDNNFYRVVSWASFYPQSEGKK